MVSESDHRHTLTDKLSFSLEAERNEAAKLGFLQTQFVWWRKYKKHPCFGLICVFCSCERTHVMSRTHVK